MIFQEKILKIVTQNYKDQPIEFTKKIQVLLTFNIFSLFFASIILIMDLTSFQIFLWNILGDSIFLGSNLISIYFINNRKHKLAINSLVIGTYGMLFFTSVIGDFYSNVFRPVEAVYIPALFLSAAILLHSIITIYDKFNKVHYVAGNGLIITHYTLLVIKNGYNWSTYIYHLILPLVILFWIIYLSQNLFEFYQNLIDKIRKQEAEKSDTLTKVIDGFIPICSNCKSIRIDSDKWVKIEEYITSKSSDVEFTHGFCNECMKKLYPNA